MELGSLDSGENDEHSGDSFVEIPKIFVMQGGYFFRTDPFGRVYSFPSSAEGKSVYSHLAVKR